MFLHMDLALWIHIRNEWQDRKKHALNRMCESIVGCQKISRHLPLISLLLAFLMAKMMRSACLACSLAKKPHKTFDLTIYRQINELMLFYIRSKRDIFSVRMKWKMEKGQTEMSSANGCEYGIKMTIDASETRWDWSTVKNISAH